MQIILNSNNNMVILHSNMEEIIHNNKLWEIIRNNRQPMLGVILNNSPNSSGVIIQSSSTRAMLSLPPMFLTRGTARRAAPM